MCIRAHLGAPGSLTRNWTVWIRLVDLQYFEGSVNDSTACHMDQPPPYEGSYRREADACIDLVRHAGGNRRC